MFVLLLLPAYFYDLWLIVEDISSLPGEMYGTPHPEMLVLVHPKAHLLAHWLIVQ